jgi:hypothetical protein
MTCRINCLHPSRPAATAAAGPATLQVLRRCTADAFIAA